MTHYRAERSALTMRRSGWPLADENCSELILGNIILPDSSAGV
jgi:hypothetical protein